MCQAVYRQIQQLGLQQQYIVDQTLRDLCRKLMALPLMPRDKVVEGFAEIEQLAGFLPGHPMIRLLQYFETNWMSDINLWNVYGLDSKTNNVCEGNIYIYVS